MENWTQCRKPSTSECLHTENTAVTPGGAERPQGSAVLGMRWGNQSFLSWYRVRIPVLPVWDESETLMRSSTATLERGFGMLFFTVVSLGLTATLFWLFNIAVLLMTTGTTDCTVGVFCSKTHTLVQPPPPAIGCNFGLKERSGRWPRSSQLMASLHGWCCQQTTHQTLKSWMCPSTRRGGAPSSQQQLQLHNQPAWLVVTDANTPPPVWILNIHTIWKLYLINT